MKEETDYRFRMSQDTLKYLYDSAERRIKAHPEYAAQQENIVEKQHHYKTEKEALSAALKEMRNGRTDCQIWAKVELVDGIYRIKNWWLVSDLWKILQAAEYTGMAQMYDSPRLLQILQGNVDIDDVVSY